MSGCCSKAHKPSCCGGGGGEKARPDFLLWGSLAAFAAGIALHLSGLSMPGWLSIFSHSCHELWSRAWWGLLIGIAAVAVLGRLPRELVAAVLGRGGSFSGLLRALV